MYIMRRMLRESLKTHRGHARMSLNIPIREFSRILRVVKQHMQSMS